VSRVASKPRSEHEHEVPRSSPFWDAVCEAAGCSGLVYIDIASGEVWLEDGSELVLFGSFVTIRQHG
jgi:hypothetical protein